MWRRPGGGGPSPRVGWICGADASSEMLALARRWLDEGIQASLETLDLGRKFDLIVCCGVFDFVEDAAAGLEAIRSTSRRRAAPWSPPRRYRRSGSATRSSAARKECGCVSTPRAACARSRRAAGCGARRRAGCPEAASR